MDLGASMRQAKTYQSTFLYHPCRLYTIGKHHGHAMGTRVCLKGYSKDNRIFVSCAIILIETSYLINSDSDSDSDEKTLRNFVKTRRMDKEHLDTTMYSKFCGNVLLILQSLIHAVFWIGPLDNLATSLHFFILFLFYFFCF
ncbi:hypothetical protein SPOG_05486 [Schizosaccharomyces cryophilus OY26]|uniref:Uncharacterized protein n=1 Tax=Schizosaccharomyces cryophilus (strain OY26 / ATCC MYA-4695 / CBS 11777 / NBRC 106824 / NRRL Y48691) TaxID=653667 RepID=S9VV95_SCHCR|nr:uncharacterized protein SPOG_05486 [Schizosaccharomyces cryophilus OY26]EPY50109.1 hypothetical protein SPOG_05486 [Schizosaccharomyces cryophilus OY26]